MFVRVETTPNPETMKFTLPRACFGPGGPFVSVAEAEASPEAARAFSIGGVARAYVGEDFVAVTRAAGEEWSLLAPALAEALSQPMEATRAAAPAPAPEAAPDCAPEDAPVVAAIEALLRERVAPALARDGGAIALAAYRDAVAWVRLRGACAGCPSARMTLAGGVERLVRHFIPEVRAVREVDEA